MHSIKHLCLKSYNLGHHEEFQADKSVTSDLRVPQNVNALQPNRGDSGERVVRRTATSPHKFFHYVTTPTPRESVSERAY